MRFQGDFRGGAATAAYIAVLTGLLALLAAAAYFEEKRRS
jgi:hypothetical protein